MDKDWKTVYTQPRSWEGRSLTADETRFVSELISTSWAQTHGMRVQQPLALMLSMKFCVSLPPEVGAAFGWKESVTTRPFNSAAGTRPGVGFNTKRLRA